MNTPQSKAFELADVLAMHSKLFRLNNKLPQQHLKTLFAIESCRTSALGARVHTCDDCGHQIILYNSCRNRHCPKCQNLNRTKWVDNLSATLLPMRHFHVVFTIPSELNRLALVNQQCIYNILFKAASQSLLILAKDYKHLGVKTGMVAVLHTWGQNLMDHPHLHTIVPAGGWSELNQYWKSSPKKFFLPVRVISELFKAKFLIALKQAYKNNELKFEGEIGFLKPKNQFQKFIDNLFDKNKKWVVYTKAPFKNHAGIVKYLGRYSHRVGIDNKRIVNVDKESVSFLWKDYRDKGLYKTMTLFADEFIRRFLLHVLPAGFCKIRYYGIYAAKNRASELNHYRIKMGIEKAKSQFEGLNWQNILLLTTGKNVCLCPACLKGKMIITHTIEGSKRAPPNLLKI
jgi:hypothetical protein